MGQGLIKTLANKGFGFIGLKDAPVDRPPRGKPPGEHEVWTGDAWSQVKSDAIFNELDESDEYVKAKTIHA